MTDIKRDQILHYSQGLLTKGRCTFSSPDAQKALNLNDSPLKQALIRARKKGFIFTPYPGFNVVIPPEYRSIGSLPVEEYIPYLMQYVGDSYYAGLLTAAEYHGAAHQRPQIFQIITSKKHRMIKSVGMHVSFHKSKYVNVFPTEIRNTNRSQIRVSTPEATAFDLVVFYRSSGGLGHVATVLSELAEVIKPEKLVVVCDLMGEIQPAQRLGYILDLIGFKELTVLLNEAVKKRVRDFTKLHPHSDKAEAKKNQKWKIFVNANIEADL